MLVYLGIDWSEKKHDVVFQDELGRHLLQLVIPQSLDGFLRLDAVRQQLGVQASEVVTGMETAHNLLIDFLWDRGYEQIYVLPPNQVKSSQGRVRQSGARNDASDAGLIAEMVRTDRHRLYPWHAGSALLQQMRTKFSFVRYLTQEVVSYSNRLRSILIRYFPAALHVFSGLDTLIAQDFIQAYPNPAAAQALTFSDFRNFAIQHGYSQPNKLAACYVRLQKSYPPALPTTVAAYQDEAVKLCLLLRQLVQSKKKALAELDELYQQHPDREIFDSLPKAGTLCSAGLLVKFGEDRQRFPNRQSVQALAGTCPITRQSGRTQKISFRRACDKDFRYIAQEWARQTVNSSPWATDYYQHIRPHCKSENHAYRCLANRWLAIVWKLWHDHILYDETFHLQRRAQRRLPLT